MELPNSTRIAVENLLKNQYSNLLILPSENPIRFIFLQFKGTLNNGINTIHITNDLSTGLQSYQHILSEVINSDVTINRLKYDLRNNQNADISRELEARMNVVKYKTFNLYNSTIDLSFKTCTRELSNLILIKGISIKRLEEVNDLAFAIMMIASRDLEDGTDAYIHTLRLSCFVITVIIYAYRLAYEWMDGDIDTLKNGYQPLGMLDYLQTVEDMFSSTLPSLDTGV